MPFLVRKLLKKESIDLIGCAKSVDEMFADAATVEFRTKKGTLSTWFSRTMDDVDDAVLAIVVSHESQADTMDFVVINTEYLDEEGLEYEPTYAGIDIAIPDLQDKHYDIENITIHKLYNCTCIYKRVFEEDNDRGIYVVRYTDGEIRDLLCEAYRNKRIILEKLNKGLKKVLPL